MQMYKLYISIYVLYLRPTKVVHLFTQMRIKRESGKMPELFPQL